MKVSIDYQELLILKNKSIKLDALERGGVDNWTFYGESLQDFEEIKSIEGCDIEIELKYNKNDVVYYNNNLAKFVSYLSDKVAVIIVEAFPNFEGIDVSNMCTGCLIGDNDNKISCNCEELEALLEDLEENTNPTYIPLIVDVSMLYSKPIVITQHEEKVNEIKEEKRKLLEKTKALTFKNIELEAREKELNDKIKALEELSKM